MLDAHGKFYLDCLNGGKRVLRREIDPANSVELERSTVNLEVSEACATVDHFIGSNVCHLTESRDQ